MNRRWPTKEEREKEPPGTKWEACPWGCSEVRPVRPGQSHDPWKGHEEVCPMAEGGVVKFQGFQKVDFVNGKPNHEWGIVRGRENENDGFESLYQVECVCGHVGKYSEQDLKPRTEAT